MSRARDVANIGTGISSTANATAITIDASENVSIAAGGDLETSTTGKVKQKGAAFQ